MTASPSAPRPEELNAGAYRRAHLGKLMIVQRKEGNELVGSDFFAFESVGTHPSGLIVTGIFENARRCHMMASAVREANPAEIAWQNSSVRKSK